MASRSLPGVANNAGVYLRVYRKALSACDTLSARTACS
ncbi:hypothetical protein [Caballeronia sp. GAFFF1]